MCRRAKTVGCARTRSARAELAIRRVINFVCIATSERGVLLPPRARLCVSRILDYPARTTDRQTDDCGNTGPDCVQHYRILHTGVGSRGAVAVVRMRGTLRRKRSRHRRRKDYPTTTTYTVTTTASTIIQCAPNSVSPPRMAAANQFFFASPFPSSLPINFLV